MRIYLVRHGQTDYNKKKLMQGRIDKELNETGIAQAHMTRELISDVKFDAVFSSPLVRAKRTAAIVGDVTEDELIIDERIIEVDFGPYEKAPYGGMGIKMTLFWLFPEIFPAPEGVESVKSMVERTSAFLKELEKKDYDNVLIAAHGGILRAVRGYLLDRKNGIKWRPKVKNCEVTIFESVNGKHKYVDTLSVKS